MRFGTSIQIGNRKTMGNPAISCYAEWISGPRYANPRDRALNAAGLIAELDAIFATRTREEWGAIFDAEKDLWWAPVQTVDEVLADPQAAAAGAFVEVPDGAGTTLLPATPVDFGGTPWSPCSMAPEQGEHTDAILVEIGRSPAAITRLRESGIVARSSPRRRTGSRPAARRR